ncbi:MAG: SDR family oxidoreductase [Phycisphaerae bacterium]|nr:SDR family oxidoreductase [Phycisphaerae bacterium]
MPSPGAAHIAVHYRGSGARAEELVRQFRRDGLWATGVRADVSQPRQCVRLVKQAREGLDGPIDILVNNAGGPGGSHYAAAKAAVNSLTKSLVKEGGEFGVTANAVAPGVILTEIHRKNTSPEQLEQLRQNTLRKRIGQPEDVAGVVAFLAGDDAGYITGEHLAVNGGLRLD